MGEPTEVVEQPSPVIFNDENKTVTIQCNDELYNFFLKMRNNKSGMEEMDLVTFGKLWMHLKPILKAL